MEDDEMEVCVISLEEGNSSLTIFLCDGALISWTTGSGNKLLVSQKIVFDGKKDVKGGAPIVLPNFGPFSSEPVQEFAKMDIWEVKEGFSPNAKSIDLILQESEEIRRTWNYKFKIEYAIQFTDSELKLNAVITNSGDETFSFRHSFCAYFTVMHILDSTFSGLKGCTYIDKAKDGKQLVEDTEEKNLFDLINKVYKNTQTRHCIKKLPPNQTCSFEKFNLPDTVLHNPHAEKAKAKLNCGDAVFQKMICVEAGTVCSSAPLEPNKSYESSLIISVHK